MYTPFLLEPVLKDYLWGGTRLVKDYHKKSTLDTVAESWELSAHPDGDCRIASGSWKGRPFSQYLAAAPACIGRAFAAQKEFPILLKLIDAQKSLSIQVHPPDDYARRVEGEQGKSESWYILDCQPDAFLYLGWKRAVTRQEVQATVQDDSLLTLLQKVYVRKGDVFYIEAGTVHAIGAGIVLAEVQQNSNATYRVYDYGRVDAAGNPRTLHIEKALDVLRYTAGAPASSKGPVQKGAGAQTQRLVCCPYFTLDRALVDGQWERRQNTRSFVSVFCVEGAGVLDWNGQTLPFKKGSSLFVPAGESAYRIRGKAELLLTDL